MINWFSMTSWFYDRDANYKHSDLGNDFWWVFTNKCDLFVEIFAIQRLVLKTYHSKNAIPPNGCDVAKKRHIPFVDIAPDLSLKIAIIMVSSKNHINLKSCGRTFKVASVLGTNSAQGYGPIIPDCISGLRVDFQQCISAENENVRS